MPIGIWLERFHHDVRYGVRTLRASPGFAAIAITMLALGIGANTAIFSLVSAVLLRPLPFPEPDRLMVLWADLSVRGGPTHINSTPADAFAWKEQSRSFEDMAVFETRDYNLTGVGDPQKLFGVRTTGNLFAVLGMKPVLGRTLTLDDEKPEAAPVVLVSEPLWRSRFAADMTLVGRTISLNGLPHTVVGVVPPDFAFPDRRATVWVPARYTAPELAERGAYFLFVIGRLKAGVTQSAAQAEMSIIGRRLAQAFPQSNADVGVTVERLHDQLTDTAKPAMWILLGSVGMVLLIACANLANLLLARGATRRRELAVRQALGASRGRVTRQLVTESAVLASIGALLGTALATAAFAYLARLVPNVLPQHTMPSLDARVLAFTALVAAVMVIGFGAGPAQAAGRIGLDAALKSGATRGATAAGGRRLRSVLAVAEITLTVVLLIGAGLLLRSYANVLAVEPGFRPDNLLLAETVLPPSAYTSPERRHGFYQGVLEKVRALPAVTSAAYVNYPPLTFKGGRVYITIEGRPAPPRDSFTRFVVSDRFVSAGYFTTLGTPIIRGRQLDDRDRIGTTRAVVINQKLATTHWPNEDPIGHRIKIGGPDSQNPWHTIVGVVGDIRQMALDTAPEQELYFSADQLTTAPPFFWPQYLVVRTQGDPLAIAGGLTSAVHAIDPDEPVSSIKSMGEVFDGELLNRNTQLTLVAAFAALALLMASIGLYGVLSYTVTQQIPEIGVRMALGAERSSVVAGIVGRALVLAGVGVTIGTGTAFALTRLLASWLFEVSPLDPTTFATAALILGGTALAAVAVPAFRGASVDPWAVLRAE